MIVDDSLRGKSVNVYHNNGVYGVLKVQNIGTDFFGGRIAGKSEAMAFKKNAEGGKHVRVILEPEPDFTPIDHPEFYVREDAVPF